MEDLKNTDPIAYLSLLIRDISEEPESIKRLLICREMISTVVLIDKLIKSK